MYKLFCKFYIGKKQCLLLILLIGFNFGGVLGQTIPNEQLLKQTTWQMFKYDVGNMVKGIGYSYTRPLHWSGKEWSTFGGIAAGTGLLYLVDEETSDYFINQGEDIPEFIKNYGENYGSPQNVYILTSGVYFTGLFTKNEKLRRTGVLLLSSTSATGLLQQVAKSAVGRARPVSGESKDTFDPFNSNRNYHSFPSGHTALAFTMAYGLGKQFKNPWIKAGIYTVGAIPGISRLWDGQHWLTDVALGFALSIFTVEAIDKYLDSKYEEKYNHQQKKLSWNLNFSPSQIGIVVNF